MCGADKAVLQVSCCAHYDFDMMKGEKDIIDAVSGALRQGSAVHVMAGA
jgi:hypothetical protein